MKRIITLVTLILVVLSHTFAQKATIYPVSGNPIKADIVEIKTHTVRYHDVPDREGLGQVFAMNKKNILYILYDDKRVVTFPVLPKDTLHVGSHLTLWTIDIGSSISNSYKNETNYSYGSRLALGVSRQWGYQLSPGASVYIGGEYRLYNWSGVPDSPKVRYNYTLNYLGLSGGFHALKIREKATWFASTVFGGGFRYYYDDNKQIPTNNKPANLGLSGHVLLNVGGALRFNKTFVEIGPYVDYIGYGLSGSVISYGLKLTTFN